MSRRSSAPDAAARRLGVGHWARGQASVLRTQVITLGLWIAVALAVLGGVFAAIRPAPHAAVVKLPESTTGAEGFASLFVSTWLRATPDHPEVLKPFFPPDFESRFTPPDPLNPPPPIEVHGAVALDAALIQSGYWSVLVGADVSAGEARGNRYYRVPVARADGRYVAVSLPSETTAPMGGVRVPVVGLGQPDRPNPTDPIAAAVVHFLGALLTGQGEVNTFSSPGSNIGAIRPAPYAAIELLTITTRTTNRAERVVESAVTVSATDALKHTWTLGYALELAQRDGRWEVRQVMGAPTLSSTQPDLTPEPTVPRVDPVVSSTTVAPAARPTTTTTIGFGR